MNPTHFNPNSRQIINILIQLRKITTISRKHLFDVKLDYSALMQRCKGNGEGFLQKFFEVTTAKNIAQPTPTDKRLSETFKHTRYIRDIC